MVARRGLHINTRLKFTALPTHWQRIYKTSVYAEGKQKKYASYCLCNYNNYADNIAFLLSDGKKKIDLAVYWRYFLEEQLCLQGNI